MNLISLWSRARHAVKRERNKPVANIDALILAIERVGCDTCVKPNGEARLTRTLPRLPELPRRISGTTLARQSLWTSS